MSTNILTIGKTGLLAAQMGINTTGHNISNSATLGYNRQLVIQESAGSQNEGFGYIGSGTAIADVQRVYSQYLSNQVITTQTSKSQTDTYSAQINQIDNQFGDATTGLSPALQDFFNGVQALASDPSATASRQSMLSAAQSLAARFQSLDGQLRDLRQGVNSQLTSTIVEVNAYAKQIASLNDAIEKATGANGHPDNDLLDQRDQVISNLSKDIQVSVLKQGNSYNVFIGSGQTLVSGTQTFTLSPTTSATDPSRTEVGYTVNGAVNVLPENALPGGTIGGLLNFRATTLDVAQNSLGRVAVGLAMNFNAQHKLGQDQNGALGGTFFTAAVPLIQPNTHNTGTAVLGASISDASKLTTSDYRLQIISAATPSYKITRLSDGAVTNFAAFPQTVDGVDFNLTSGAFATGDDFVVKPTVNGAANFSVAITDTSKIASAAPLRATAASTNLGVGKISAPVDSSTQFMSTVTLTYAGGNLTGYPATLPVTVTTSAGVATTYVAGTASVPYAAGSTISFGGATASVPAAVGAYNVVLTTPTTLTYHTTPVTTPVVSGLATNTGTLGFTTSIANPHNLTGSDYKIDYNSAGATYTITRLSDNVVVYPANAVFPPVTPIDGLNFIAPTGVAPGAGTDHFIVAQKSLSGFPPYLPITVTNNGVSTTYAAGTLATPASISYADGATISYGGISYSVSGIPTNGDTFSIVQNTNATGDNRNALLLGALQTTNTLGNSSTTYQGAYAQLISNIGTKANELNVNSTAESQLLTQAQGAQQSVSGVNLDEEATNLLRYQQAYQAAGKLIQTASTLFDVLLSLHQ